MEMRLIMKNLLLKSIKNTKESVRYFCDFPLTTIPCVSLLTVLLLLLYIECTVYTAAHLWNLHIHKVC